MTQTIPTKNWITPKAEIKSSKIHGKGLFAKETIQKGEIVIVWGGHHYTDKKGAEKAILDGKHIMQWDDDIFSFEGDSDDVYSINHSCDSNLWMDGAFTLTARKEIKKNDELTLDYALWLSDETYVSKWTCNCGKPCCRKIITGKDYRMKAVQSRYTGHFSPLMNKKIACQKSSTDGKKSRSPKQPGS